MHWYLRVISNDVEASLQQDASRIEGVLTTVENASFSKPPEEHPRGGYSLFIECDESDQAVLISALERGGFRGCI